MENPLLTIITVTYNCEKTLQRTIDSVFNQNIDNFEYLIIDGGSVDNTLPIIKSNISKFNGKLNYISEPDNGLYDAMNKGIRLAKGDYIGIINGDDYYQKFVFENVIQIFKDENADVVYSDLLFTTNNVIDKKNPLRSDSKKLKERMSVNHPTCFVKKSVYEKYKEFNTEYQIAADYELMTRLFIKGCRFRKSSKILAVMESGGLSSNNWLSIEEKYRIHNTYFGQLHALKHKFKNTLLYFYRKNRYRYGG